MAFYIIEVDAHKKSMKMKNLFLGQRWKLFLINFVEPMEEEKQENFLKESGYKLGRYGNGKLLALPINFSS